MKRISLIIPCLNEGEGMIPLLESLHSFRKVGCEVILVDGGSSDNSRDLALSRVDRLVESAAGRGRQMNAGARVAKGDILWFLHADTHLSADSIMAMEQLILDDRHRWGRFDIRLSGDRILFRIIGFMMNWRSRLTGIATGDQGIFVDAALFTEVGGFPEIPLMEDIALSRKLKGYTRPLCIHHQLMTSSRRWERRGVIKTILLMWRLRLAYAFGADPAQLARLYR